MMKDNIERVENRFFQHASVEKDEKDGRYYLTQFVFDSAEEEFGKQWFKKLVKNVNGVPKILVLDCPGRCGNTMLGLAAYEGNVKFAEWLLLQGADINMSCDFGHTPLLVSCDYGHFEMVKFLIEKGADPTLKTTGLCGSDSRGDYRPDVSPLDIASVTRPKVKRTEGHDKIVEFLTAFLSTPATQLSKLQL